MNYQHATIKKAALKSFENHLRYMTIELASCLLFDDRIGKLSKQNMVSNQTQNRNSIKKININTEPHDLINVRTHQFLIDLGFNLDFLDRSVDD
jgi:hypothetical protein